MNASGRHYVPDVMVVELPYARGKVVTDVPAVVFEIKSPDDKLDDVFEKCLDYASLGIQNIIVLDPDHRRQYRFANSALQLVTSIVLHLPKAVRSCLFQRMRCLLRWMIDREPNTYRRTTRCFFSPFFSSIK